VALFVGTHERQLDDKGRLALPASFRTHLGDHCYLLPGQNNCLRVVPSGDFEHMAADLMAKVARGEVSMQYQRVVAANATPVSIDGQGRVKVEEKLRSYAGLSTESKALVNGNFTELEIWAPDRYERVQEIGNQELAGDL
jgi:MraZ protein